MASSPNLRLAFMDRLLFEAELTEFYGTLTFQFKKGIVTLVRREETLTPSSLDHGITESDPMNAGEQSGAHDRLSTKN